MAVLAVPRPVFATSALAAAILRSCAPWSLISCPPGAGRAASPGPSPISQWPWHPWTCSWSRGPDWRRPLGDGASAEGKTGT